MLRDIKADESIPVEILIIGGVLTLLIGIIIYFIFKFLYKKFKKREIILDKSNSKEFAYQATKYLKELDENHPLIGELEKYKYKKDVPELDKNLVEKIELELKGLK